MKTKYFFITTALVEVGTGMALAIWPSMPVSLLLDSTLTTTVEITIGRVAGAALFSLGAACWLARDDEHSRAAIGLIVAMLLYNTGAVAILGYAGRTSERLGVALWPGVLLHAALAAWCIACIRTNRRGDCVRNPAQGDGGAVGGRLEASGVGGAMSAPVEDVALGDPLRSGNGGRS
jgi:hypothetical protein